MTRLMPLPPILDEQSADTIAVQLDALCGSLQKGLCGFVTEPDDQTDAIKLLVARLLAFGRTPEVVMPGLVAWLQAKEPPTLSRSLREWRDSVGPDAFGVAVARWASGSREPELVKHIVDALRRASPGEARKMLGIRIPRRARDWGLRYGSSDAYFQELERSGDVAAALIAAYDAHFGKSSFARDLEYEREVAARDHDPYNDSRHDWPYPKVPQTRAACRMVDSVLPVLRAAGFDLLGDASLLAILGLTRKKTV